MQLAHWIAMANRGRQQAVCMQEERQKSLKMAVRRGAFWGDSDCRAAWEAMRWVTLQSSPVPGQLQKHWKHFVDSRVGVMRAYMLRGLEDGAFRHPRHAWNALEKLRRTGTRDKDFLDAWQEDIERRLDNQHKAVLQSA